MDKKIISSLVRDSLQNKIAQLQDNTTTPSPQPPQVVNIGEGLPVFKQDLPGPDFAAILTRPLTEDEVYNSIMSTLNSIKFDPQVKYTPQQIEQIVQEVQSNLQDKFAGYLNILNPQIGEVKI